MHHLRHTFSLATPNRRGRAGAVLMILALTLATRATAVAPIRTYETLALKDGRQLSAVRVINYTTTDVLVRHDGGATSISTDLLPARVLTELHLPTPQSVAVTPADPAFNALANKVAVADPGTTISAADTIVSVATPTNLPLASVGENSLPATSQSAEPSPAIVAKHNRGTFSGRVAVSLPSGETHLLGDVEVRAYPAELLTRYLAQARAKSAELAEQLYQQAGIAAQEGRSADSAALIVRAKQVADQYLALLPTTPHTTRSDAYGHFTLRHDLRDMRLVAVGRINVANGEWNYAWIAVAPGEDALLTEANATLISAPGSTSTRFATR